MSLLGGPEFIHVGQGRYLNVAAIKDIFLSSEDLPKWIEEGSSLNRQSIVFRLFPSSGGYVGEEINITNEYHIKLVYPQIKQLLGQNGIRQV